MILSYCTLASELEKSGMGHLSVEWYQRAYQVASKFFLENTILQELKKLIDLSASANIISPSPNTKESRPLGSSRREMPSKNTFTGTSDDYEMEDPHPQIPSKTEELIAVDKVSIRARPRSALPRLLKEKDDVPYGNYDEAPPNPVKVTTSHKPFQQENNAYVGGIAGNDGHDYYDIPRPKSAISKLGGSYNGPPSHSNHGGAGFASPNSKVSRMDNNWYHDNGDEERQVLMVDDGQFVPDQEVHAGYGRNPSPPPPQSPQLHARYDKYFPKGRFGVPSDTPDYDAQDDGAFSSNHRRPDDKKTSHESVLLLNNTITSSVNQRHYEDSPSPQQQQPHLYSSISTPLLLNPSHHSIVLLPSHSLTQLHEQNPPRKSRGPPKHPILPRKTLASELLAKKKRSERSSNEDYMNHHEDSKIKSSRTLHSSSDLPLNGSSDKPTTATTSKQNKTPLSKMFQESSQQRKRPSSSPSPSRKHQHPSTSTPNNLTVSPFHIHNNPLLQIDEFGKEKIKKIADYCFPYFKGLRIEAKYQIQRIGDRGKWYPGRIIKIDFLNGLYDIEFENGDKEKNISVENIRIPEYASKLELLQSTTKALLSSTKGGGNNKNKEEDHLSEKEKGENGQENEKKGKKSETITTIPSKLLRKQYDEEMHISTLKLLAGINQRSEQRKIERLLLKNLLITKIQSLIRGILLRKRFPKIRQQLMKEKQLRKKEKELRHMEQQLMNNHHNGSSSSFAQLFDRPHQLATIEVQTGQSLFEEEYDPNDDEQRRRQQHSSPLNIHPTHSYLETPVATDHNGGYYPDEEDGRAEVSVKYGKFLNENDGSPILFGQGEGHPGFKGANSDSDIILIPMDHLQQRPFFEEKFAEIEKINIALLQIQEEQKGLKELDLQRNQELLKQFHQLHSLLLSQTEELRQIKQQETTKKNNLQKPNEKKEGSEVDSDNSQVIDRIMSNEYHATLHLKEEKSVARNEEKELAIVNHTVTFSNPPDSTPAPTSNRRMKISLPSSNLNENSIGMEVSIENSIIKSEDMRLLEEFGQLGVEDFWNSVSTTDFPLMPKSNYRKEIEQPSTTSIDDPHFIPRIMEELINEGGDVSDTPEKRSTPLKSDRTATSNGKESHHNGGKPVTASSGKTLVGSEGSVDFDEIDRSVLGNSQTPSPAKKSHRKNDSPRRSASEENKDPLRSPNLSTEDCCNPN
jgi:hypothetical protein